MSMEPEDRLQSVAYESFSSLRERSSSWLEANDEAREFAMNSENEEDVAMYLPVVAIGMCYGLRRSVWFQRICMVLVGRVHGRTLSCQITVTEWPKKSCSEVLEIGLGFDRLKFLGAVVSSKCSNAVPLLPTTAVLRFLRLLFLRWNFDVSLLLISLGLTSAHTL